MPEPTQNDLILLDSLIDLYDAMADLHAVLTFVVEHDSPIERLTALHRASECIKRIRSTFSDAKGAAAYLAHGDGMTYPAIAQALECSEPYVQQMIYRGRRVGGRSNR